MWFIRSFSFSIDVDTDDLICFHMKKYKIFKSGDLGGHDRGAPLPMYLLRC